MVLHEVVTDLLLIGASMHVQSHRSFVLLVFIKLVDDQRISGVFERSFFAELTKTPVNRQLTGIFGWTELLKYWGLEIFISNARRGA